MKLSITFFSVLIICAHLFGQANNELYNNGALIRITSGAEISVMGDVHNYLSSGTLSNDGLLIVQGNMYSDNLFQQRGLGTTRIINSGVNTGQVQFISGSYAVRGGQSQIGVNDGSFYNLELCNDQGIVWLSGSGNVADVRNSIDFYGSGSPVVNRIITHDPSVLPLNGDGYNAVFGLMNPTAGLANLKDNTITTNGNMSPIDNGYIQGKFRRAILSTGGNYEFVLGLEPAGAINQKGVQNIRATFGMNNYDCITGYFMTGIDNTVPGTPVECNGYQIDYFGGTDHGQWILSDMTGVGSGSYEITVWPQDHNFPSKSVWIITKDNSISGTADQCGPTTTGLTRSGFDGFSQFGVAGADNLALDVELVDIWATSMENVIQVNWKVASEYNLSHYVLERKTIDSDFDSITTIVASGFSTQELAYYYYDEQIERNKEYYYRFRSVDFDGSITYSPVVSGRLSMNESGLFVELHPNPASELITMGFISGRDMQLDISLINSIGQQIEEKTISVQEGSHALPLDISHLSEGVYFLRINNLESGIVEMMRFIKQ